jgi:hypothetical protein
VLRTIQSLSLFFGIGYVMGMPALSGFMSKDMSLAFTKLNQDVSIVAYYASQNMASLRTDKVLMALQPSKALIGDLNTKVSVAMR